jgi:hypothetical protein
MWESVQCGGEDDLQQGFLWMQHDFRVFGLATLL